MAVRRRAESVRNRNGRSAFVCLFVRQARARPSARARARLRPANPQFPPRVCGTSPLVRVGASTLYELSPDGSRAPDGAFHPSLSMARAPVRLEEPSAAAVGCPIHSDGLPRVDSALVQARAPPAARARAARARAVRSPFLYIAATGKSAAAVACGRLAVPSSGRLTMPSQEKEGREAN